MDIQTFEGKILIVDDETKNVSLLEQALESGGYLNVKSTSDAREALPLFEEFSPDIVPGMFPDNPRIQFIWETSEWNMCPH